MVISKYQCCLFVIFVSWPFLTFVIFGLNVFKHIGFLVKGWNWVWNMFMLLINDKWVLVYAYFQFNSRYFREKRILLNQLVMYFFQERIFGYHLTFHWQVILPKVYGHISLGFFIFQFWNVTGISIKHIKWSTSKSLWMNIIWTL